MTHKRQSERKGGVPAVLAVGLLVLLAVLYVLSSGPAAWLVMHNGTGMGVYCTVYAPISQFSAADRYRAVFVDERQWRQLKVLWLLEYVELPSPVPSVPSVP